MRRTTVFLSLLLSTLVVAGCTNNEPESDEIVPVDQVPPQIMDVARKQLPGYTFNTVFKMKINGEESYEIRGKNKRGKIREVEVSAKGEVLAIE